MVMAVTMRHASVAMMVVMAMVTWHCWDDDGRNQDLSAEAQQ